jgi:hypothetical protein
MLSNGKSNSNYNSKYLLCLISHALYYALLSFCREILIEISPNYNYCVCMLGYRIAPLQLLAVWGMFSGYGTGERGRYNAQIVS